MSVAVVRTDARGFSVIVQESLLSPGRHEGLDKGRKASGKWTWGMWGAGIMVLVVLQPLDSWWADCWSTLLLS